MTSASKDLKKRHNPIESICRKLKAIQKREAVSNVIQPIVRFPSIGCDNLQTPTFEEVLRKMTVTPSPRLDSRVFSSRGKNVLVASPRASPACHLHSPERSASSALGNSEKSSQSNQLSRSWSRPTQEQLIPSTGLKKRRGNAFSTSSLGFHGSSGINSKFSMDSVVKRLSLNEDGWKTESRADQDDVTCSPGGNCEEEVPTGLFHAWDPKPGGTLEVGKIMDYLRQSTCQGSEDSSLEELWAMLDPEKTDTHVDLETVQAIMREWMALGRSRREAALSGSSCSPEDSVFEPQDSMKSVKMTRDPRHVPSSFRACCADPDGDILEVSDLMTCAADLYFRNQKLQEENDQCKLALDALEETNRRLAGDCAQLRLQIQSAQQTIKRTNVLKEELEDVKISLNASEEQRTVTVVQNKQLETENRALILKISALQEENIKNMMDTDLLEKKIEELTTAGKEHQIQLNTFEKMLLAKDTSVQEKELIIDELKTAIIEYRSLVETLRGDRSKLVQEVQHLQLELIEHRIPLDMSGARSGVVSEGERSLRHELALAQSIEDEDISETRTFIDGTLQWRTNPEMTVRKQWTKQLVEFKDSVEQKLSFGIVALKSLENHKESCDKTLVRLIDTLKKFRLECLNFRRELLSSQKHLEVVQPEDAVNQEDVSRKRLLEGSQWLVGAQEEVKDRDQAAVRTGSSLPEAEGAILEGWSPKPTSIELPSTCRTFEQTSNLTSSVELLPEQFSEGRFHGLQFQKQFCCKPRSAQEARIYHTPLALKSTCWQTSLLEALALESLSVPRLDSSFSCFGNPPQAPCERPQRGEMKNGPLDVTRQYRCLGPTSGPISGPDVSGGARRNESLNMEENGTDRSSASESTPQLSREHLTLPSAGHASSPDSIVTSSDLGSETLPMTSRDLDHKSLCEKEEETRSTSTMIGTGPAHQQVACPASTAGSNLEAGEDPTTAEHGKVCVARDAEASPPATSPMKSVTFPPSDNASANEKEVEAEFLRLSLGLKCDWFTLEKRVRLEERSRDLAEDNLKKEIINCVKLVEALTPLCEDDNQAQEILKKLQKSITLLGQCSERVASRAEMLGAINQESRVSKAVEVMVRHVENLKRMYAKEHAELEELKQALLQNERPFSPLEDEDDCQIKKRSSSLNSKPSSLRRVTIASLPRNLGNVGTGSGMENGDRFSRRLSSWRILGTKPSEKRPSLHRFISSYSWADAEDEKSDRKTKENLELPGEVVERTRKPSLSEKKSDPSKREPPSVCHKVTSWAVHVTTSVRQANKTLWLSVAFVVLFAALMSFLTGRFFQKAVEAAPTQERDSWMSLEHILWPLARLRHNGPPPM